MQRKKMVGKPILPEMFSGALLITEAPNKLGGFMGVTAPQTVSKTVEVMFLRGSPEPARGYYEEVKSWFKRILFFIPAGGKGGLFWMWNPKGQIVPLDDEQVAQLRRWSEETTGEERPESLAEAIARERRERLAQAAGLPKPINVKRYTRKYTATQIRELAAANFG